MSTLLVTGANKGLGFGLVLEFLKDTNVNRVFATFPAEAGKLIELKDPKLRLVPMDVSKDDSIKRAFDEISKQLGDDGLNLLVNNAGILVDYATDREPRRAAISQQLDINAISPVIVTQYFLPLLKKAAETDLGCKVCNISSDMASISGDKAVYGSFLTYVPNMSTGILAYRMSKSALNAFTKCMAVDLAGLGIVAAGFHPGWVRTDLGGDHGQLSIEEAASALMKCFRNLTTEKTGGYFNWKGEPMPY